MSAKEIIEKLKMAKHPEGGYYKETYRCEETMMTVKNTKRSVSTAIYFLLQKDDKSMFHRIQSDELWFFHQGSAIEIVLIENRILKTILLGNKLENGEMPQATISANTWFAAKVKDEKSHALVSCTVAPGFDFADFELATRDNLLEEFPHLKETILAYTKEFRW